MKYKKTFFLSLTFLGLTFGLWIDATQTAKNYSYPTAGSYIQVANFKVFYRQIGSGPNLVLIHGIGASEAIWSEVALELSKKYRVTLIDLPGSGRSSKIREASYSLEAQTLRLKEILTSIGIRQTFLVGSSMGGAISLWLAKTNPTLVKKTSVISPATNQKLMPLPIYKIPQLSYIARFFNNKLLLQLTLRRILSDHSLITKDRIASSLKNLYNDNFAHYTFIKAMEALDDPRLPSQLNKLTQPTMILYGLNDRMIPKKYMEKLNLILPNSELIFNTFGGHHLMEDQPKWVANHLDLFFSR